MQQNENAKPDLLEPNFCKRKLFICIWFDQSNQAICKNIKGQV
jgi:hypothetical protein